MRLIDADALIDEIKKMYFSCKNHELDDLHYGQNVGYDVAIEIIEEMAERSEG